MMRMFVVALVLSNLCLHEAVAGQPAILSSFYGNAVLDNMGNSLDGNADVDGDGVMDHIIAASGAGSAGSGQAYVYSGINNALIYTFYGTTAGDGFAESVAMAGDVNNDGHGDLIVGAPDFNNATGYVHVYSGFDGSILHIFNGNPGGPGSGGRFGQQVDGAGDVNNDGFDDLLIGAPQDSTGGQNAGQVVVKSGVNGATLYTYSGVITTTTFNSFVGYKLAGSGDINLDGFDDFIISGHLVFVYSGATGLVLFAPTAPAPNIGFGSAVDGLADVNGDGFRDFVIGAYEDDTSGSNAGAAFVYSGLDGTMMTSVFGPLPQAGMGIAVSDAGDVDGDGLSDIATGAPSYDSSGLPDIGIVQVWRGNTGALLGQITGDSNNERMGWDVALAGDLNGDGFSEILAGAPKDSTFQAGAGKGIRFTLCGAIYYGNNSGPNSNFILTWSLGPPGGPALGTLGLSGAVPNSAGVLGVSSASASISTGGLSLLIDVNPGNWFFLPFTFGGGGVVSMPVDLSSPSVPGSTNFFLQGLEDNGGALSLSNGMRLVFCP